LTSIDSGAGLERVAAVVQGVRSNYDTDLLKGLVERAASLAQKRYLPGNTGDMEDAVSMRVLADHARATAFLLADNVTPANEGRGYVLRRIMRRAIRHGVRLGLKEGHFSALCGEVVARMGDAYPELVDAKELVARAADAEDQSFRRTLDRGLKLLDEEFARLAGKATQLPGEIVFKLYDTYGFPADLTRVIAEERCFTVDEAGFGREMEKQRARGEFAGSGQQAVTDEIKDLEAKYGGTEFLGYETTTARAQIIGHTPDKKTVLTNRTPFYGESGGQVGDTGTISGNDFEFAVTNTEKTAAGLILHHGHLVRGDRFPGPPNEVELRVDEGRRDDIRANHSATHLVHLALKEVLGSHVAQKGSLVAADRLRFDFAHFAPMTDDEKRRVEDLVNDEIRRNLETQTELKSFDEAKRAGAVALFGEKYGDRVRVLRIGGRSVELCGGTHVRRAGDIGLFKITQEVGIAQGVRRLEAVTGRGALQHVRRLEAELDRAAERVKAGPFEVAARVEKLQETERGLRRELEELKRRSALSGGGKDLMSQVREVGGVRVLAARTEVADPKALRDVADRLREQLKSGVVVLGGVAEGKVALVAAVTADLTGRLHAGKIIGEVAKAVGGKGGGRADMAQAGGPDAEALDAALDSVFRLIT
jgi:alanyl-tRNA synthetase